MYMYICKYMAIFPFLLSQSSSGAVVYLIPTHLPVCARDCNLTTIYLTVQTPADITSTVNS